MNSWVNIKKRVTLVTVQYLLQMRSFVFFFLASVTSTSVL